MLGLPIIAVHAVHQQTQCLLHLPDPRSTLASLDGKRILHALLLEINLSFKEGRGVGLQSPRKNLSTDLFAVRPVADTPPTTAEKLARRRINAATPQPFGLCNRQPESRQIRWAHQVTSLVSNRQAVQVWSGRLNQHLPHTPFGQQCDLYTNGLRFLPIRLLELISLVCLGTESCGFLSCRANSRIDIRLRRTG